MTDPAFQEGAFQGNAYQSGPPLAPIADFTLNKNSGESPLVVQFTDTSENYPDTWLWEYNLGSGWKIFSNAKNPRTNFNFKGVYSIRLTVSNESGIDTATKTACLSVSASPYTPNNILKDSIITKRINEAATNLETNLSVAVPAHKFLEGDEFEYSIYDSTQEEFTVVKGVIEDVNRDSTNGTIYKLAGRDKGRLFVKQPFSLDCKDTDGANYSYNEVLEMILVDTDVEVGRGQAPLRTDLKITTNNIVGNTRWCGQWDSKQDALTSLFESYRKQAGLKKIRWFIDFAGYLRWFEINSDRMGKKYIFKDDDNLISFKPAGTAREVINVVTVRYGDESTGELITLTNETSIARFGKCITPNIISDANLTRDEIIAKGQEELDQKSIPIYSGVLLLAGFNLYEPGTQIIFHDDFDHSDKTFTVVDWTYTGPENITSMNLTTDETVISIPNEIEVMQAVAQNEVQKVLSDVAIVTSDPAVSTNDRITCFSTSTGAVKNVRNINKNENAFLGG
ncbi:PKD domain-containing protein [Methanobacterium sp.]|uniref:PKD domain-containing protein n=1 Tax=Methanobacterium sp. TaxID=2164 RepID=UPI002ABC430D|nr:PKD domain-containing protein [Methanobacterium sp.]MDY9922803.1 PKD domain-containing protein [Methanobacterium sp.]